MQFVRNKVDVGAGFGDLPFRNFIPPRQWVERTTFVEAPVYYVAVRAYDGCLSMVDGWLRFSPTVSWVLPGGSDHTLCWS